MAKRKQSREAKRLAVINKNTTELHEEVDNLYENLVDGEAESVLKNLEDLKAKTKLLEALVKDGDIIKPRK